MTDTGLAKHEFILFVKFTRFTGESLRTIYMNSKSFTIPGSSGKPLSIDLTLPATEGAFPLAIFVHGFKGFKDWGAHHLTSKYFASKNVAFLRFNFSHSGISTASSDQFDDLTSFGLNTFSKELFDLDQIITFAISGEAFPIPEKLFLIGHSRGGGISIIQTAEDKRIDKLVTWASLSNFRNLWPKEQEDKWLEDGVIYIHNSRTGQQMPLNAILLEDLNHHSERLDILNAARNISIPWLIIHGAADSSVPVSEAHELSRQQKSSKLLQIDATDHTFGAVHPWTKDEMPEKLLEACEATLNFFLAGSTD